MEQTILYLVRHGESLANQQEVVGGDTELTEQGKQQVQETRDALQDVHFDEAYSSNLKRAIQTAEILFGKPIDSTNQLHILRERDFGSLEGGPNSIYDAASEKRKTMTHEEGWMHKHVPDYESDHEVSERFLPTLRNIARENLGRTVLIAGHGSAIRVVIMTITGYTYDELPSGSFINAGYTELRYDEKNDLKVIQINGVKL